jgi:hypothetical protein
MPPCAGPGGRLIQPRYQAPGSDGKESVYAFESTPNMPDRTREGSLHFQKLPSAWRVGEKLELGLRRPDCRVRLKDVCLHLARLAPKRTIFQAGE